MGGSAVAGAESFGRVDSDGIVYVRSRSGVEREVGQWPDADPAEALALYTRRFEGLVVEVDLLERRVRHGALSPAEAAAAIGTVRGQVVDARAVGDLEALVQRLDALEPLLQEQREQRRVDKLARQEQATVAKERLVADAERLAGSDEWRNGLERLRRLMDEWKAQPRIDRAADDALWRRFSAARTAYARRRKEHLAEVHEQHDQAGDVKRRLADEAELLADSTDWGPTAGRFRELMREWKDAGPASRRDEGPLWRRFRGAQDRFFGARDADTSKAEAAFASNAEVKRALLTEAEQLVPAGNLEAARATFRELAERWDAAGKVPREQVRELEQRLRAVESALRTAQEERWRHDNPEARARAEGAVAQLESALADLRARSAAAEVAGDRRALAETRAAIEARESWLAQARATLDDVT